MSYDLNDAQPQMAPIGELIPDGTFAKVRLTIRPGGVPREALEAVLGTALPGGGDAARPSAPR